jgi:nickel/cobalt exporter
MEILTGAIIISLLHALIPNHWLPIIAIGRQHKWSINEVSKITFITASAHILSTVLIGVILGYLGHKLSHDIEHLTHVIAPVILILMGLVYIYRHYKHKHFHLHGGPIKATSKRNIIISLSIAMFMSPCMEIEALFLMAGTQSMTLLATISLVYAVVTLLGMLILVRIAYKGLLKFDSHKLEHNAGIITGVTLILTGLVSIFIH